MSLNLQGNDENTVGTASAVFYFLQKVLDTSFQRWLVKCRTARKHVYDTKR